MTRVLGIDLGTSNSAAAIVMDGDIKIIPPSDYKSKEGKPFPSVVSFSKSEGALIGNPALEQSIYNPNGTFFHIKRKIGTHEKFEILDKEYPPQFIAALILLKIKLDAESFLKEKITKAVITVPAYFNDNQRQATKDAGAIAGLDVIRLITEPVAAAISYGFNKIEEPNKVLVFDMGAGTLDVSILEIEKGFIEVIATGGNTQLGGLDIDNIISEYLTRICEEQNKIKIDDPSSKLQLQHLAEKTKIKLSLEESVTIDEILFVKDSQINLKLIITREQFDEMISEKILKPCQECIFNVLNDKEISPDKIDRVILVGGPSKIPAIKKLITTILREPETGIDPNFSVARGAAIQGALLANDANLPDQYTALALLNVTPLDLGEQAVMKNTELGIKLMIPKNTTYPTQVTQKFYKKYPKSPKIEMSVWQGDFNSNPNFLGSVNIGKFWLYVPEKEDLEIDVTYKIDSDGILTVSAVETSTGNQAELKIDKIGGAAIPPPQLDWLKQETEKIEEEYHESTDNILNPYERPIGKTPNGPAQFRWMCICLNDAKTIINAFHKGYDCKEFLGKSNFELFIQDDKQYAYGYIGLGMHPYYPIGIHTALRTDSMENRGMLTVVLIHELLHAIHPDWGHDQIRPAEHVLANKAGLYDALRNMDVLFLSGKMSFCNNQTKISDNSTKISCSS